MSHPAHFASLARRMKEISTLNHKFVPKHIRLTEEEKKELLEKYNISLKQLPRILKNDQAIKEANLTIGDIVKIIRRDQISGSIYYRVVV